MIVIKNISIEVCVEHLNKIDRSNPEEAHIKADAALIAWLQQNNLNAIADAWFRARGIEPD